MNTNKRTCHYIPETIPERLQHCTQRKNCIALGICKQNTIIIVTSSSFGLWHPSEKSLCRKKEGDLYSPDQPDHQQPLLDRRVRFGWRWTKDQVHNRTSDTGDDDQDSGPYETEERYEANKGNWLMLTKSGQRADKEGTKGAMVGGWICSRFGTARINQLAVDEITTGDQKWRWRNVQGFCFLLLNKGGE